MMPLRPQMQVDGPRYPAVRRRGVGAVLGGLALVTAVSLGAGGCRAAARPSTPEVPPQQVPWAIRTGGVSSQPLVERWTWHPTIVEFPDDGATLDEGARGALSEFRDSLLPRTDIILIRVVGFASGHETEAADAELARARAQAVVDHLGEIGLPRELFEVVTGADAPPQDAAPGSPQRVRFILRTRVR